jgi:tRNA(Arg) A34 adenosine deaminase TadA
MTTAEDEAWMALALAEADLAAEHGDVPVGAVVVDASAPAFGSNAPYTTRAMREFTSAPAHMTHGSSVTNRVAPSSRQ